MAEIQNTAMKNGKTKRKQRAIRIDLTPMVDLGFLLITFFIFTTTLMQSSIVKLNLPEDGPYTNVAESKTMSLVLYKSNKIGYYVGNGIDTMKITNYSPAGIRQQIQLSQERIAKRFGSKNELYVVIKPTVGSDYQNIVAVLDEMLINDVKRYILAEATESELAKVGNE